MKFEEVKRLIDIPDFQLKNSPLEVCMSRKVKGKWESISTQEFIRQVNLMSIGLLKSGIKPGDKIALITTTNRPEWNITDMALLQIGAVNVPLYPTISSSEYEYIMSDSDAVLCFVSDLELAKKVEIAKSNVKSLQKIYTFDHVEGYEHWSVLQQNDEVAARQVLDIKNQIKDTDLATIIYTSGTTGVPKGVMLSHRNLVSNAVACTERIPYGPGYKSLSFLPINHVYERMKNYLYLITGISIHFAESMDTIGDNIREVKPHVFSAVPRLLEKVYDRILEKGNALTGLKKKIFFWSLRVAEQYDPHKGGFYKIKLAIARKLVFSKWQEGLGGNIKAVASGSAPLQPRLARIFLAAGVNVWEGYGLTETSPVISVNCTKNDGIRIGTVGRVINGVTVKIAHDGEICVKGPNIMMGYYKKPEQTAEVIDSEGWFHTGDIGELVEGEFLKITDRKKEMFKTSGGKYIAPQKIENLLKGSVFIEQSVVIGSGQKFPAAIIVPAFSYIKSWLAEKGVSVSTNAQMVQEPLVIEAIKKEVERINGELGSWEQIKKVELLNQEFTIQGGELTPTLKLKRKVIDQKYEAVMAKIYKS